MIEPNSARRQTVDIRRLHQRMTVTRKAGIEIVRNEKKHIEFSARFSGGHAGRQLD
jgi:hypothetical protein